MERIDPTDQVVRRVLARLEVRDHGLETAVSRRGDVELTTVHTLQPQCHGRHDAEQPRTAEDRAEEVVVGRHGPDLSVRDHDVEALDVIAESVRRLAQSIDKGFQGESLVVLTVMGIATWWMLFSNFGYFVFLQWMLPVSQLYRL